MPSVENHIKGRPARKEVAEVIDTYGALSFLVRELKKAQEALRDRIKAEFVKEYGNTVRGTVYSVSITSGPFSGYVVAPGTRTNVAAAPIGGADPAQSLLQHVLLSIEQIRPVLSVEEAIQDSDVAVEAAWAGFAQAVRA